MTSQSGPYKSSCHFGIWPVRSLTTKESIAVGAEKRKQHQTAGHSKFRDRVCLPLESWQGELPWHCSLASSIYEDVLIKMNSALLETDVFTGKEFDNQREHRCRSREAETAPNCWTLKV
ncbi:hypothetical protein AOLI_G00219360 [Acnodon oligacanthus]